MPDDNEFRAVYRANYWRVLRFIGRRFGLSREDAEDVTQEVFIYTYLNYHLFTHGKIFTWLCAISMFKTKDFYRKRATYSKYMELLPAKSIVTEAVDPSAQAETNQTISKLSAAVESLPQVFLDTFEAFVIEGKSQAAIAKEDGCKEGTVSARVYQVRKRLNDAIS